MGIQCGFGFSYASKATNGRTKVIIVGIWVYFILWGIAGNVEWTNSGPPIVITKTLECASTNKYYVIAVFFVVFYTPIVIMGYLYTRMYSIAHHHATAIHLQSMFVSRTSSTIVISSDQGLRDTGDNEDDLNDVTDGKSSFVHNDTILQSKQRTGRFNNFSKATKTIAAVCGCFLACWLPVSILAIGLALSYKPFENTHAAAHIMIVDVLPVLNSTLNPFIYFVVNNMYRKALRKTLNHMKNLLNVYLSNLLFGQ